MKRLVLALVVALAAAALAAGSATAGGPPCTNIVFGDFGYAVVNDTTHRVSGYFELKKPACADVTYNVYVQDAAGTLLGSQTISGATLTGSIVSFSVDFAAQDPAAACVYATAERRGNIADRAPNTGCDTVSPEDSGGGGGFD